MFIGLDTTLTISVAVLSTPPGPENAVGKASLAPGTARAANSLTIPVLSGIRKEIWGRDWSSRSQGVAIVESRTNKPIRHPPRPIRCGKGICGRIQSERVEYVFLDVAPERRASRDEGGGQVRKNNIHEVGILQVFSEPCGGFQVLQPFNLRLVIK
jgi:hypothetical protein